MIWNAKTLLSSFGISSFLFFSNSKQKTIEKLNIKFEFEFKVRLVFFFMFGFFNLKFERKWITGENCVTWLE